MYVKQSKGHCPFFFPQHFSWPGPKATGVIPAGVSIFSWFVPCPWVYFLKLACDFPEKLFWSEGESWKEAINGRRTTRLYWERHPVAGITSLPTPPPKARDCLTYSWSQEDQTRHRHGLQRGSIYIPSWFTCFLQILQLYCRQINAVICLQQGGGNPLWHFLFLNSWSCFVFPKPYWSTRLMIVFLKALFCSLCHRGSPRNYN